MAYGYSIVSVSFVEKTILPPLHCFKHLGQRSVGHSCVGLFQFSQFYFIDRWFFIIDLYFFPLICLSPCQYYTFLFTIALCLYVLSHFTHVQLFAAFMKFLRGIKLEESHCLNFKVVISLTLFLYYNIVLAILVPLSFNISFRITLPPSVKKILLRSS